MVPTITRAWAYPYEAADTLQPQRPRPPSDWDALVRRGVFLHPEAWGSNAAGTGGGEDIFQLPEAVNGIPQVFALLPHAASLMLRARDDHPGHASRNGPSPASARRSPAGTRRAGGSSSTPPTQGLAGWPGGACRLEGPAIETEDPFAVVVATSVGPAPIATRSGSW